MPVEGFRFPLASFKLYLIDLMTDAGVSSYLNPLSPMYTLVVVRHKLFPRYR